MRDREFKFMLQERERVANTLVCVGLDPVYGRDKKLIPKHLAPDENMWAALRLWGMSIVDATVAHALCYKPNFWYWVSKGPDGLAALREVVDYIHKKNPLMPIILDYKVGDIGATCEEAAELAYDYLRVDAVTATPYVGIEALMPLFARRPDKGIILIDKTSNPGAEEFQDLITFEDIKAEVASGSDGMTLYERLAHQVAKRWDPDYGNFGLVAGATQPQAVGKIRKIAGENIPLLIPGFGKQGGSVASVIPVAINSSGVGVMANSSGSICHASSGEDYAKAAEKAVLALKDEINRHRPLK